MGQPGSGALKQFPGDAEDVDMKRCGHVPRSVRTPRWMAVAARWVELLWRCPCQYTNVATYRCFGCGARPPRALRASVAASAREQDAAA